MTLTRIICLGVIVCKYRLNWDYLTNCFFSLRRASSFLRSYARAEVYKLCKPLTGQRYSTCDSRLRRSPLPLRSSWDLFAQEKKEKKRKGLLVVYFDGGYEQGILAVFCYDRLKMKFFILIAGHVHRMRSNGNGSLLWRKRVQLCWRRAFYKPLAVLGTA